MDYVALGQRVRQYRLYRNLTQLELGPLVGISTSFLGHIERGSRKASLDTLLSIANALQVPTDILLTDSLRFRPDLEKALLHDMAKYIQALIDEGPAAL